MKRKVFSVLLVLAVVLALMPLIAAPAGATTLGVVDIEKDWYATPDTVKVTVDDADYEALTVVSGEELAVGNGVTKYFAVSNTPIADITGDSILDAADVKVYSDGTRVSSSIIESVTTSGITLGIAPGDVATILTATDVGDTETPTTTDLMATLTQPSEEMTLRLTAGSGIVEGDVTITGTVGGETGITDTIHLTAEATVRSAKAFTAISAIDAGALRAVAATTTTDTLAIEGINVITTDYSYGTVDTVEVTATSTGDVDGEGIPNPITVILTETEAGTGLFEGTFALGDTHTTSQLVAADGDTVTVTYTDDDPVGEASDTAMVETVAPTITALTPPDAAWVNTATPTFSATLADDRSGIDETTIVLEVDGATMVHEYDPVTGVVSYTPTSDLTEDTHTVSVDVDDFAGNSATTATWTVGVDLTAPPAPTGLTAEAKPLRINLAWTAPTDPSPTGGIASYNIYRSTTEGVEAIADIGSSITNSYVDTTGEDGVTYYYVATAVDAAGNEGAASNEVSATFSVEYPTVSYSITLTSGWNLMSIPAIPENTAITSMLASIDGSYSRVWSYWGGSWYSYDPAAYYWANTLSAIEDGKGYWIYITTSDTLEGAGYEVQIGPFVPPTYELDAGWNLIGFKPIDSDDDGVMDDEVIEANTYLASISDLWSQLSWYDPALVQLKDLLGTGDMEAGHGYWIYMTAAGTIVAPAAH